MGSPSVDDEYCPIFAQLCAIRNLGIFTFVVAAADPAYPGDDVERERDTDSGRREHRNHQARTRQDGMRYAFRALRHRDFAFFWGASIASSSGTWLQNLAVPWVLYQITGSALWVGLATACLSIPMVLVSPAGGALADTYDPKRILFITQSLLAVVAVAQCVNWLWGIREPWAILSLVVCAGILNGLNQPNWASIVNGLVPREDLRSAVTLNSMQINAAKAIGPAAAGVLLATFGAWAAFLVNATTFVIVIIGLSLIRSDTAGHRPDARVKVIRGLLSAGRYAARHPGLRLAVLGSTLIGLLGFPVLTFTIVLAEEAWQVGSMGMGALNVALGLGAVAIGPVLAGWDRVLSRGRVMGIGLPIYGAALVGFGLSPSFPLALALLAIVGAAFFAVSNSGQAAAQMIVANKMRGRLMALKLMSFMVASSIGATGQGAIADLIGARSTVVMAGGLLLLSGILLLLIPSRIGLRRLDDPQDPD